VKEMRNVIWRITVDRVVALTTCLLLSVSAFAQDDHRITADVGAMFSTQRSVSPSPGAAPSEPRPGVGGTAFGVVAGAAIRVSDVFDVGGELSVPARFDVVQTSGGVSGTLEIANHHRDTIASAMLRLHSARRLGDRLRFEVLGGPSVVWESTLREIATAPPLSNGPFGPFSSAQEVSRAAFGVAGGADADIPLVRHVSLVPEARLYWIFREDSSLGTPSGFLRLDSLVFRAAIALRVGL
jgi:hypothetical protein